MVSRSMSAAGSAGSWDVVAEPGQWNEHRTPRVDGRIHSDRLGNMLEETRACVTGSEKDVWAANPSRWQNVNPERAF